MNSRKPFSRPAILEEEESEMERRVSSSVSVAHTVTEYEVIKLTRNHEKRKIAGSGIFGLCIPESPHHTQLFANAKSSLFFISMSCVCGSLRHLLLFGCFCFWLGFCLVSHYYTVFIPHHNNIFNSINHHLMPN